MTWAKTKIESVLYNLNNTKDDADAFLAEDEYRRRKPHPNFKSHLAVEKNIIKLGKKSTFKTFVIAAGLQYHAGDGLFHHFLKVFLLWLIK
jgi:adenylate kinase